MKLAERLEAVTNVNTPKEAAECIYTAIRNTDITLLIIKNTQVRTTRILEEAATVTAATVAEPNDNVIYIKPDAIFGLALSFFIFVIAYIGIMCLYNTPAPLFTPRKAFKYGREM